ncbi:MAG: TonB-dependent receptor [Muribaculaceae bacterium]|nr:TonB-dependent receptor [Muribaculaceae bacterium]
MYILIIIMLAMVDLSAYAVEVEAESFDSTMLEEVIVQSRRKEIIQSQRLDGAQLQSLNSQSVADALRYFSGIQVKDFGGVGGIKTINIRSMGSHHVGVFYDGIQLGNAQNGQIDLGRYSLDNIEEINLYNGQKSNIFQGAKDFGSSGTIYIRTRRPRWKDDEQFHLMAQLKTGSFGLINPEVVWEQRLSDRISLSASASYTNADGEYDFHYRRLNLDGTVAYDTTATRHNSDIEAFRAEVSTFGYLDHGQWCGKVYYYDSERGIPGAIVNNVFRNGERQWDRNLFVQGSFEYSFSPRYQIKGSAKWAWDYMRFLRDDPKELYIDNSYYQQEAYLSVANIFRMTSWWDLSASIDTQWNTMNANMSNFMYPTRWTQYVSVASALKYGGLSAQASVLGSFVQDRIGNEYVGGRRTTCRAEFTPALFLSWQPLSLADWHINGFVKKAFRMPTFNDLYYTEVGNKDLEPEYTWQYSIGSSYNKPTNHPVFKLFSVKGDAYYNKVTNKIVAYPSGQQFRWTMLNLGMVEILGVELGAETAMKFGKVDGALRLNYTYQKARDFTDRADSYYGDQIPYIPLHSGSVAGRLSWRGWDFNYSFIYTGERYNAQENIPQNHEQPWYTHDASLVWNFPLNKVRCRVGLEVNNIFDQDYEVILNYPMPGRNYKVTLKINI